MRTKSGRISKFLKVSIATKYGRFSSIAQYCSLIAVVMSIAAKYKPHVSFGNRNPTRPYAIATSGSGQKR